MPGGLAVSARRIASHFATSYSVTVVTPSELVPALSYRASELGGIRVVEIGKSADTSLFLQCIADVIEKLGKSMANPKYMAFYCNALAYATTLAAQRKGASPLLFARGNDIDLEVFGESAFFTHYALSHAHTVFCVSSEIQSKVKAFCHTPTRYIPNGANVDAFKFQEGYQPKPRPSIGLFGDIKQKKGLDTLLAAIDFNRFSLRIVGELREDSRKLLHGFFGLHPQAHVEHVAYVQGCDDLITQYREVDIVCIPSRHEGMSNVMLEAMSLGKLCVCSSVGGALDVVQDGTNGFLFDPGSSESLELALERAANCLTVDHESIRQQASSTVRNGFSLELERQRYLQALLEICP